MTLNFLPFPIEQLTDPDAIALAKSIEQRDIFTPLSQQPIATTYVHQSAAGTPVLLLHGFDSSVLEFRRLLPLLAVQQDTWAIDLLGFGFTDRSPKIPLNPDTIKTHLYACWQTLINRPVVLVGASMGGAAAIDFALTYPEVVEKLVLIDSAGFTSGPALGKFLVPPLGNLAAGILQSPKVRQQICRNAYHDPDLLTFDDQLCGSLHLQASGWKQALIAFTRSGGYPSFKDQLSQLQLPTLILWGESDRILGTKDAGAFKGAIAQSQLIWIPRCGHLPHLEQSQLTAQHILDFLS
ncbi:MAG: alpha/beta hydrolase [Leptolyngbyaceae bacterium]|nr:alpha/beta hydrolase [Leptolyngbyaceae bacterium]